jgi:hypothetical protein
LKNTFYKLTLGILITFLSALSNYTVAQTITRGPYIQMISANASRIRFRTDVDSKPSIILGKSPSALNRTIKQTVSTKEHEINIDSLTSNTRYYYKLVTATQSLGDST